MEYSLSAAAKVTGASKSTLFRALRSGRLSGRRDHAGTYIIDAAELARVFPLKHLDDEAERVKARAVASHGTTGTDATELAVLRTKLEAAEAALTRERELVAEFRQMREKAEERAQRAEERVLLLTAEKSASKPEATPASPTLRPGLLSRLFGRG